MVYINKTKKGRGVFSQTSYKPGDIIERCPIIEIPKEQIKENDVLSNYVFPWGEGYALVLGFGSLYNHSYTSNAKYQRDFENRQMLYVAVQSIAIDEEIYINYNGDPNDPEPVWFDVV